MSAPKSSGGVGCVGMMIGLFAIAILMWALTIAFWLLGLAMVIGGLAVSIGLIVWGWRQVGRKNEIAHIDGEISAMANDVCSDLQALQLELMSIANTKGIGTPLEEELALSSRLIDNLMAECTNAIRMCETAPETAQRLQAISRAQETISQVKERIR